MKIHQSSVPYPNVLYYTMLTLDPEEPSTSRHQPIPDVHP